ncbi:hypothetical protein N9L76_03315 [bacterium]|nr:hypothetical protein [bacterium]
MENNGTLNLVFFLLWRTPYLRLARRQLGSQVVHFLTARRDDEDAEEQGHADGEAHESHAAELLSGHRQVAQKVDATTF